MSISRIKKVRLSTDWISRDKTATRKDAYINTIESNILEMILRFLVDTGCNKQILKSVCRLWYNITLNFIKKPPPSLVIVHNVIDISKYKRETDLKICLKIQETLGERETVASIDEPQFEEQFLDWFKTHVSFLHCPNHLLLKPTSDSFSTTHTMYAFLRIIMCRKKHRVFNFFVRILSILTRYNTYDPVQVTDPYCLFRSTFPLQTMISHNLDVMFFAIKEHLNDAFCCLYRNHPTEFDIYEILAFMRTCCVEENMDLLKYMILEFGSNTRHDGWHFLNSGWLHLPFNWKILSNIIKTIKDILSKCKNDEFREPINGLLLSLETSTI